MANAAAVEEKAEAMFKSGRRNVAKALGDAAATTEGRGVLLDLDRKMLAVNKAAEDGDATKVEEAAEKLYKSLYRGLKKALGDGAGSTDGRSQVLDLDRKMLAVSKAAEG